MITFLNLGLDARILKGVQALGFETPTPIQAEAIPQLLEGHRDLVGLAQTGTGKTAAFGLPLLQLISLSDRHPQALVLAPTRELCVQIYNDLEKFAKELDAFSCVAVYGGASIVDQIKKIRRGVQVVVATPGRLIDLIERGAIDLGKIQILVLDEADEMLNMGFKEDIDYILANTPDTRNTWLFSATMPKEVSDIAGAYMEDPIRIVTDAHKKGNENIEHCYTVVKARDRYAALKRFVDTNTDIFGIVFCRTKIETQEVAEKLMRDGYNADSLHGDLSQVQRDKVMRRYRDRSLQLLVATDVAARGIDVQDVTHVIHYDLPDELENYMHRSGRTARAGKTGVSIAIIHTKEAGRIKQIEKATGIRFAQIKVPTGIEVCEKQLMKLVKRIHNVEVNQDEIAPYIDSVFEELKDLERDELIRRFVSIEFNRFLEYYRDAVDLNADTRRVSEGGGQVYGDKHNRMFISIGAKDGLDKGKLLRFVCDETGESGSIFGRIDVKGVYSFVDVLPDKIDSVMKTLNGSVYKGRNVRTERSGEQDSGNDRGTFRKRKYVDDRQKSHSPARGGKDKFRRKEETATSGFKSGGSRKDKFKSRW